MPFPPCGSGNAMFACFSDVTEQCLPEAWILVTAAFIFTFLFAFVISFLHTYGVAKRENPSLNVQKDIIETHTQKLVTSWQLAAHVNDRASFSRLFRSVRRLSTRHAEEQGGSREPDFSVSAPGEHEAPLPPQSTPATVCLVVTPEESQLDLFSVVPPLDAIPILESAGDPEVVTQSLGAIPILESAWDPEVVTQSLVEIPILESACDPGVISQCLDAIPILESSDVPGVITDTESGDTMPVLD